jgi:hypothetical protein
MTSEATAAATSYTVAVYGPESKQPLALFWIPPGTVPSKRDGRLVFAANIPSQLSARALPISGRVVVGAAGKVVHDFEYRGRFSGVRWSARCGRPAAEQYGDGQPRPSENHGDGCPCAVPADPAAIAAEFAGFSELPDDRWIQLNPSADTHAVQLRLRKVPPAKEARDAATGDFLVYAVTRFAIQIPEVVPGPKTDLDKAFSI